MIAVDTNVLVRLLTNDDPEQARRAAHLVDHHPILVPKTILLETEWVLRYAYELDRHTINKALSRLLGLPNVSVESPSDVAQALSWHEYGFDFADALHLTGSSGVQQFATFDRALVRRAGRLKMMTIIEI